MSDGLSLMHFVGRAIRARRNRLGLSQEELAERAGLHRTYVADIERAARNPTLKVVERLAGALKTSAGALLESAVPTAASRDQMVEILLVQDLRGLKATVRALRKVRLQNHVQVMRSAEDALVWVTEAASEDRPHLILLDLETSGCLELLRGLRREDEIRGIPVVLLVGTEDDARLADCRRLGVATHVVRPIDSQRLCQAISQLPFQLLLIRRAGTELV